MPILHRGPCRFAFVVQSNLVERRRGASTTFAPRRLRRHPSSYKACETTSKLEMQNLWTEQSAAAAQQCQVPKKIVGDSTVENEEYFSCKG